MLHAVGAVGAGQLVPVTFEEEMQAFMVIHCIRHGPMNNLILFEIVSGHFN